MMICRDIQQPDPRLLKEVGDLTFVKTTENTQKITPKRDLLVIKVVFIT